MCQRTCVARICTSDEQTGWAVHTPWGDQDSKHVSNSKFGLERTSEEWQLWRRDRGRFSFAKSRLHSQATVPKRIKKKHDGIKLFSHFIKTLTNRLGYCGWAVRGNGDKRTWPNRMCDFQIKVSLYIYMLKKIHVKKTQTSVGCPPKISFVLFISTEFNMCCDTELLARSNKACIKDQGMTR